MSKDKTELHKRLMRLRRISHLQEATWRKEPREEQITVYCKGTRSAHASGRRRLVMRLEQNIEEWDFNLSEVWRSEKAKDYVDPEDLLERLKNHSVDSPLNEFDSYFGVASLVGTELEVPYWYPVNPPAKNLEDAYAMDQAEKANPLYSANQLFRYYKFAQCPECKRLYGFDLVGLSPFFDQLLKQGQSKIAAERLAEMKTLPPLQYMGGFSRREYRLPTLAEMVEKMPVKERQRLLEGLRNQYK